MSRPQSSVIRSAAVMGAATFLSRIMGLVREQVFAHLFGAGLAVDAFNIAFRIPNLLRDLFAEGAMSAALVPTFTRVRELQGPAHAWRLASTVFRVLLVTVSALSLVGILFADPLVGLYASAFRGVPGKFELAVELTRMLFPFFPLVALAAAYMAVLNASGVFFMPALASALFNLTSVVTGVAGTLFFSRLGREPIHGMALGVVLGGAVQAFCQLPDLRRRRREDLPDGVLPQRSSWYRDPDLRAMFRLMVPGTLGLAATQINILVNSVLATSSGPGAVSWLNYAFRLMQFPIGIFGVSLAQATLPRVSAQWVRGEAREAGETLHQSLVQVFAINLPAAVGLAVLGVPLIGLLFEHGHFGAVDTAQTANALAAYAVGLAAYSGVKVLVPVFYAFGNTRIPVISSILSVGVTIVLNLVSVRLLGFWGLALGTSIAAFVNFGFLLFKAQGIITARGGDFRVSRVLRRFAVHSLLSGAMGLVCAVTWRMGGWMLGEGVAARLGWMGVLCLEAGVVLVGLALLFGVSETREVIEWFAGRVRSRLKSKIAKKTV